MYVHVWVWWLLGGGSGLAVIVLALSLARAAADGDRYLPRHVSDCDWCGRGARCTCREIVEQPPEQDFYGSMSLADERTWLDELADASLSSAMAKFGPMHEPSEAEVAASRALHGYIPELDTGCPRCGLSHNEPHCADGREWGPLADSGPGVVPMPPPGPDPEWLCSPEQPHEKPAGTESAGSGHLGPRAQAVWDRWEARHQERWAFA